MKKLLILSVVASLVVLYACKHDIVNPGPVTPPTGGVVPPVTGEVCFDDVLPIFRSSCAKAGCHDAATKQEGYVFDSYANIIKKDIKPGNAAGSKVFEVMIETGKDRMPPPPAPGLLPEQIELIKAWINQGAKNTTGCASTCDTTVFTFTAVKKIIDANCLNCHSGAAPSGGWNFSTHAGVKAVADNGKLMGSINHAPGFTPMPAGNPKLSDCKITQIRKWIQAGTPNN
ncbi:MAG TPA: hypothetical protein VF145_03130 [Chitinophagaceae bacterium]